jgi:chorismate mutase-like protein
MTDPIRMSVPPEAPIEALRRDVDSIDDALHDLLMRRAEVVIRIGALKASTGAGSQPAKGSTFLRPGREAVVMRRLVGRHAGPLPKAAVIRIWRELVCGLYPLQGPFAVAVLAQDRQVGLWDLARDHFGSTTPITAHESSRRVVRVVIEGKAMVGILPMPEPDEEDPWWRLLLAEEAAPQIFAKLPFTPGATLRGAPAEAFAIGLTRPDDTGRDRSLFAIEVSAETSRSSLAGALKAAGLDMAGLYIWRNRAAPERSLAMLELDGFLQLTDERLAKFQTSRGQDARSLRPLGGYAIPFTAAELAPPRV